MATAMTTAYVGEVLETIITQATQGNPTIEGGHINVIGGVHKALYIPRIAAASLVQDRTATPTTAGTLTWDESVISPTDYMIYTEFDPAKYEDTWRPYQPTGNLVFEQLPAAVQLALTNEIMRAHAQYLETALWTGDTAGAAPYDKFNGVFKQLSLDATVIDVATPLTLSAANIVGELGRVYALIPDAVKYNTGCKIMLSQTDMEFYNDAQRALGTKGLNDWEAGPNAFKGMEMVALPGIPASKMTAGVYGGAMSNVHLGLNLSTDATVLQYEKKQANSELYFFKLLMKAGIGFGWGSELVAYNA